MKKLIVFFTLFLLFIPVIFASEGHMKLLAVTETDSGSYKGASADLYLEVEPGTGRIFLDTFPLSKIDTQISTRLAKETACTHLNIDCDYFDFFYTIRANSAIVAGPSAGAAITELTIAVLDNQKINENASITGTINSGGLIGPVGGIKEKINAAQKIGLKLVLIPEGERISAVDGNDSLDLIKYGRDNGIEVIEVSDIDEAAKYLIGKSYKKETKSLEINPIYSETMRQLAQVLCNNSKETLKKFDYLSETEIYGRAENYSRQGFDSYASGAYYSAASYCFGANVRLSYLDYLNRGYSKKQILGELNEIEAEIKEIESRIPKLKTITDLETYALVKERLEESRDNINKSREMADKNINESLYSLAYAKERVNSALSWEIFFGKPGKEFNFNKDVLMLSCQSKIAEAEERYQYVKLFFPDALANTGATIKKASNDLENESYDLCLFRASKAKAESDVVLSTFGITQSQLSNLMDKKAAIVKRTIAEQTSRGIFPIAGYSYYEYANSLRGQDVYSALIFYEYALELSNLDAYFKEQQKTVRLPMPSLEEQYKRIEKLRYVLFLLLGLILGIAVTRIYYLQKFKSKSKRK